MARPKKSDTAPVKKTQASAAEELEDFGDEENEEGGDEPAETAPAAEEEEAPPPVMTRKQYEKLKAEGKAGKPQAPEVTPMDSLIRDKKGKVLKDVDGDDMLYAPGFLKQVGFVNENGVRFPPGFKFDGGFVGSFGNVVLNRCPKCGHQQTVDEARTGKCGNERAPDGKKKICGFDMVGELEKVDLDEIA